MLKDELNKLRTEIIELTQKYNDLNAQVINDNSVDRKCLHNILSYWNEIIKPIEEIQGQFFEQAPDDTSLVRWREEWCGAAAQARVSQIIITCLSSIHNKLSLKVDDEVANLNNINDEFKSSSIELRDRIKELHRFFNMVTIQTGIMERGDDV